MESDHKTKILIWGPGRGHNISLILNSFNLDKNTETIFISKQIEFKDKFENIKQLDHYHPNKFLCRLKLIKTLIKLKKQDVFYIQGNSSILELIIYFIFAKFSRSIFNVWSEGIIDKLGGSSFESKFLRAIFQRINIIHCNWYGTYNKLNATNGKLFKKALVIPWGIEDPFPHNQPIESSFLKQFLKEIDPQKNLLMNMRSIAEYNAIETLLEALTILRAKNKELFKSILLIFWAGNNIDKEKKVVIEDFIKSHNIQKHIRYVEHPFVSQSDIYHLIKRSDILINLVKHDQLSISVIEGFLFEKNMIMSDIEPYRILNEKYNLNLTLTSIEPNDVANQIERFCFKSKDLKQNEELAKRRRVAEEHFLMRNNFNQIIAMINS